jgi:hypothetical protein
MPTLCGAYTVLGALKERGVSMHILVNNENKEAGRRVKIYLGDIIGKSQAKWRCAKVR